MAGLKKLATKISDQFNNKMNAMCLTLPASISLVNYNYSGIWWHSMVIIIFDCNTVYENYFEIIIGSSLLAMTLMPFCE